MNQLHNAYSILGLEPGSSREQILARCRRLVRVWHPDKFPSAEEKRDAEEELEKINQASNLLFKHFESAEHNDDECACLPAPGTFVANERPEDNEEKADRLAKKRAGEKMRKRKSLNSEDERDRRFAARLDGRGGKKISRVSDDEDNDDSQRGPINEKSFNFIIVAVAAVIFIVGWLSTLGSSKAPNQAQQTVAPQFPQSAPGQNQQMNPFQQLLRSTGEQPSEEQAQPAAEEQPPQEPAKPPETQQDQSQQSSE